MDVLGQYWEVLLFGGFYPFSTRLTSINPPVMSEIPNRKSNKPIQHKQLDQQYIEYCRRIQREGTTIKKHE